MGSQGKLDSGSRYLPSGGSPQGGQSPSDPERALLTPGVSQRWKTTDSIRRFQPSWRVRECGRWAAWGHTEVDIVKTENGFAFGHLHHCGSVWSCPACAHTICLGRATEVSDAVGWWRSRQSGNDLVMMSLTVRHRAGNDLLTLRKGMSAAWRRLQQTRTWRGFRAACGVAHLIRCHEVTHGEHGWHPHLHVLLMCTRPDMVQGWASTLVDVWRTEVPYVMGSAHRPSREHAAVISPCHDSSYIARMGLELGSPSSKAAAEGHNTAMQLAQALADTRSQEVRDRLAALWREYSIAMRGCHQLQWSRGLRDAMGAPPADVQVASAEVDVQSREPIAHIPRETWREMAVKRGVHALDSLGVKCKDLGPVHCRDALVQFFQSLENVPAYMRPDNRLRWIVDAGREEEPDPGAAESAIDRLRRAWTSQNP